jgi:anti-sigma B factor antagonist
VARLHRESRQARESDEILTCYLLMYTQRMSLTLNSRQLDSYTVLEASGEIEAGPSCLQFHEFAKKLIAEGARSIVVDMKRISYIDSAGLGQLLSIYATLKNKGGSLKLQNVDARVKEALNITNLLQIFEIVE